MNMLSVSQMLERRSKKTQKESMTALFIPKLPGLIKKFLIEGEVIKDLLYIMEAFDSRALIFSSKGKVCIVDSVQFILCSTLL